MWLLLQLLSREELGSHLWQNQCNHLKPCIVDEPAHAGDDEEPPLPGIHADMFVDNLVEHIDLARVHLIDGGDFDM